MTQDMFEDNNDLRLLTVVKGQLNHLFAQALRQEDKLMCIDWFSVRANCTPETRALSIKDWQAAVAYEDELRDRLCQITGETPKVAQGVWTTAEWTSVLEEH